MYQCGLYLHSITHSPQQPENPGNSANLATTETTISSDSTSVPSTSEKNIDISGNGSNAESLNCTSQSKNKSNYTNTPEKPEVTNKIKKGGVVLNSHILVGVLIITNLPVALYTSLLHQRGTLDVMKYVHEETKFEQVNYNSINVLFLMPCHSTPYYR